MESLAKLKASRMKELVMKKRSELEEICRMTHIEPDTSTSAEKSSAMIDSGTISISCHQFCPSCFFFSFEVIIVFSGIYLAKQDNVVYFRTSGSLRTSCKY